MTTTSKIRRRPPIKGIARDAEALGVSRVSLYRAIHGVWDLQKLVARYEALKAAQAREASASR